MTSSTRVPGPFILLAGAMLWWSSFSSGRAQEVDQQLALHQQRAREAEAKQDFAGAVREYRALLQAFPDNVELESNLGVALYFNHDFVQAADVMRRAITRKPTLYAPHLFLGLAMAQLGKPDAAVMELEKAVTINGADPLAHTWLGYEYTSQSRFDRAADQFQITVQQKPNDQDAWFALGRCYLELAKKATMELLRVAPDGGRTWQLAGEQYEAQDNRGKALKLYMGALQRRPDLKQVRNKVVALGGSTPAAVTDGDKEHGDEDRFYARVQTYEDKAKHSFQRVAQIAPDSFRSHQVLGDSLAASNRFDDAIPEYRMVLERKPDLPGIHGDLCNALLRIGRIQEAIKECEAEIAISPYSAEAYVQEARLRILEDDPEKAAALLQTALALDRPPITAYKLKARVDVAQEKFPAAIESLKHYLAVESNDASAWFLLARAYKSVGDSTEMRRAIDMYKRTSDAAKGSGEALRALDTPRDEDTLPGSPVSQQ